MSRYGVLIEAVGPFGEEVIYNEGSNLSELAVELVCDTLEWLGCSAFLGILPSENVRNERKLETLGRKLESGHVKPSELRGFRYQRGNGGFQITAVVKGDAEIDRLKREYTRCSLD